MGPCFSQGLQESSSHHHQMNGRGEMLGFGPELSEHNNGWGFWGNSHYTEQVEDFTLFKKVIPHYTTQIVLFFKYRDWKESL